MLELDSTRLTGSGTTFQVKLSSGEQGDRYISSLRYNGVVLWTSPAESYFKSWNTAVKLIHRIPRSTFTYLVEGHFVAGHTTLRDAVLSRYPGFLQGLLSSPTHEVRVLARVVVNDPGSVTRMNVRYLTELTELSPRTNTKSMISVNLPVLAVPATESWRLRLIDTLVTQRRDKYLELKDLVTVAGMLDSLCNS